MPNGVLDSSIYATKSQMSVYVLRSCAFPFKYPTHGELHRSEPIVELLSKNNTCVTKLLHSAARKSIPLADRPVFTLIQFIGNV
jgi:hypothetical protein